MDNQFGLNGMGGGQLTGLTVSDTINNINNFQTGINQKYDTQKTQDLENSAKTMYECSVKTDDGYTKNMNLSGANTAFMELIIKQASKAAGSTKYDNLGQGEILCKYLNDNPSQMNNTISVQKNEMGVGVWAKYNNLDKYVDSARKELVGGAMDSIQQTEAPRKGKSFGRVVGKTLAWGLPGAEIAGWAGIGYGKAQEGKLMDKYTATDADAIVDYEQSTKSLSSFKEKLADVEKKIAEIERLKSERTNGGQLIEMGDVGELDEELKLLNSKRDTYKGEIAKIEEEAKNYPKGKPITTKEAINKNSSSRGGDLSAAGDAAADANIYYVDNIKPYLKNSDTRWNLQDILKSITKEDVKGLTDAEWEDAKALINKEIAAAGNSTNLTLEELHDKGENFRLSKKRLEGQNPESVKIEVNNAIHTKINKLVQDTLEAENPGANMRERNLTYSRMLDGVDQLKGNAVKGGKRTPEQGIRQDVKGLVRKPGVRRFTGKLAEKVGYAIKPSTYILKLADWIGDKRNTAVKNGKQIVEETNNVAQEVKEGVSNAAKSSKKAVKKMAEEKKLANPKLASQQGLFGSPMDFAGIFVSEMLYGLGLEPTDEIVTDIVSYALETNKLNKEGGRNLPLYDKENSYVNQNPNRETLDDRGKIYPSIESTDWYQALLEEERMNEEEYRDAIEDIDIDELIKSLK